MATNRNIKRPRLADDNGGDPIVNGFMDLPMQLIIRFLPPADRLAMSSTCKDALAQVEIYCEHVLKAIAGQDDCNIDDSFHERIRDQSRVQPMREAALPFRFLVQRAFTTHLSQIVEEARMVVGLVLSPSQNRLATKMVSDDLRHKGFINVFDLSTKDRVASLDLAIAMSKAHANGHVRGIRFLNDDKILFCSEDWICLWTLAVSDTEQNVQLVYETPPDTHETHTWVRDILCIDRDQFIFVAKVRKPLLDKDEYEFRSFDVRTRSLMTLFMVQLNGIDFLQLVGTTCHQKWLVFSAFAESNRNPDSGHYVYNLQTNDQVDFWGDCIGESIQQSAQCSNTFCTLDANNHEVIVWNVDEASGKLSQRPLFKVHSPYNNSASTCILAVSEPHVMIEKSYGQVIAYNMNSGKAERHFRASPYRHHQATVSTLRSEWYLTDGYHSIYVYRHSEPRIF